MTRITLANRDQAVYQVKGHKPLLDELRDHGVDLPYGCRYGGCITCAANLISGEVDQRSQVALNNRQIKDGYIVLCVARAKTDCVLEIGVESFPHQFQEHSQFLLAPHTTQYNHP